MPRSSIATVGRLHAEYWDHGRRKDRPVRQVYRLLKQKDVRKDLAGQEVHVYWPEDQQWYRAEVEEVSTNQSELSAYLHYPDTDEYEDVNLGELIEAKQVAVIETRSFYAKLKRDEIPVSVADRLNAVYEDEEDPSEEPGVAESDEGDNGTEAHRVSREHHKQVQRTKRPLDTPTELAGPAKRQAGAIIGSEGGAGAPAIVAANMMGAQTPGAVPLAAGDSDMVEAEAFRNSLLNALMHSFGGAAAGPSAMIPTPGGGMIPTPGRAAAPMIMIPTPGGGGEGPGSARGHVGTRGERGSGLRHQGSLPSAGSMSGDEEVRCKVREQLVAALQKAAEELQADGCTEALPAPAAVAAEVELELYKLHGHSVSKDYKAKFRSLSFNLKDGANPGLRARVLRGELPAARLVTLGPAELARKELSEWMQRRQEEAAKMVFLDAETAAKFSTAAAAALAQSRIHSKDDDAPAAKPTASPERAPAAEQAVAADAHTPAGGAAPASDGAAAAVTPAGPTSSAEGHRRTSGVPRMDSGTHPAGSGGGAGGGAGGDAGGVDLPQRPSVTSLPSAPGGSDGGAAPAGTAVPAAAAGTLSPAKRTVLRAALPAAHVPGDETPPREDQDGDAPYDPGSYDDTPYDPEAQLGDGEDDPDLPKYEPYDPTAAAAAEPKGAAGAPSIASLRGAAPGPAPGAERQGSLPSPLRSPRAGGGGSSAASGAGAAVSDLVPVISRPGPGEGPMSELPPDNVGDTLWSGVLRVPGPSGELVAAVEVTYLGGSGRLGPMLRCGEPPGELLVKGQVKLSRVEQFFEELRRSRSRTISLALVRPLGGPAAAAAGLGEAAAAAEACGGLAEFAAQHGSRTGLATPGSGLEAYLVARGGLAARLLKTARAVCPSHQLAMLPEDIGEDQVLLAMVHPRAWEPPPHALAPHPPAHAQHHQHHHHRSHHQHPGALPAELGGGLPPSPSDGGGSGAVPTLGGSIADPRRRGQGPPAAGGPLDHLQQFPPHAGPGPAAVLQPPLAMLPGGGASQPGGAPIDLGALSDLAAALGIPGGGGGAPAPGPGPVMLPPELAGGGPGGPDGGAPQQLVTMVMQNPDGTLAIVAVPQGGPTPPPPGAVPVGGPGAVLLQPHGGPVPGPGMPPAPGMQPAAHELPPPYAAGPPPHPGFPPPGPHGFPEQGGQPPFHPAPGGPPGPGPYSEPPPPEHYGGAHGPPPPGRYPQAPPPPGPRGGPLPGPSPGGPPPPYMDPRAGPPPPHQGYPPPGQHGPPRPHPDPYYGGPPQQQHPYRPPPGPEYPGGEPGGPPYGPPRDGPDGRPPPYYPPRDGPEGGGYDDRYFHRGGPPGPHDPFHGGPPGPRGGHGPPPPERGWGGEHGGGRWGGRGGGRGRGGHEDPRGGGGGGYGYEYERERGGGRGHPEGGYGGRGREWGGGGGRGRGRGWEGDREWGRGRGGYERHEGYPPR